MSFIIAAIFETRLPPVIISICENIGGYWMITFLYFLVVVLIADLFRLTDYFFAISPNFIKVNYPEVKLIYFGFVILTLVTFSVIGYIRFSNPKIVELNLNIPKKNNLLQKLSIIVISDVHLGDVIRKNRLEKYVELINNHNPDIILIAGDLFDRNLHSVEKQKMNTVLRQLKAKYGVYAILGNHEYFNNVNRAVLYMTDSHINVLRDSAVTIDNKFVVIGRDDFSNKHRKSIKDIITGINKDLPLILLDHQPVNLADAVENNIDVQISGHTHNGQIYPFSLLVSKFYELAYGYKRKGNTHFYVSSGLGLWGAPIRLGTQSEIVNIQLNIYPG
jgi:predicted MPP superfamily phosphohydrolase